MRGCGRWRSAISGPSFYPRSSCFRLTWSKWADRGDLLFRPPSFIGFLKYLKEKLMCVWMLGVGGGCNGLQGIMILSSLKAGWGFGTGLSSFGAVWRTVGRQNSSPAKVCRPRPQHCQQGHLLFASRRLFLKCPPNFSGQFCSEEAVGLSGDSHLELSSDRSSWPPSVRS